MTTSETFLPWAAERSRTSAPKREKAIPTVEQVRGKGLWVGIVLKPEAGTARAACERLMRDGVLAKDTHVTTIRLAPPLCVTKDELRWALDRIVPVLETAGEPA